MFETDVRFSNPFVLVDLGAVPADLITADLDNDGDDDVLVAVFDGRNLLIENLSETTPGAFAPDPVELPVIGGGEAVLNVADVDNDGDLDLLVANGAGGRNSLFLIENLSETSPGAFADTAVRYTQQDDDINSPTNLAIGDVDGDGDLDAIVADDFVSAVVLVSDLNRKEPEAARERAFVDIADRQARVLSLTLEDVDGDGDLDVLAFSRTETSLFWIENVGAASDTGFAEPVVLNDALPAFTFATFEDVDGDGDTDLVATVQIAFPDVVVAVVENVSVPGAVAYASEPVILTNQIADPSFVEAADFDGDGDLDLAVDSVSPRGVFLLENTGEVGVGSFDPTPTRIVRGSQGSTILHAVDVDGDGDQDLLTAGVNDRVVQVLFNDGVGPVRPTPLAVSLFDAAFYLGRGENADLLAVGIDEPLEAFAHWFDIGFAEGRVYSPLLTIESLFDDEAYVPRNSQAERDIAFGSADDPVDHYISIGSEIDTDSVNDPFNLQFNPNAFFDPFAYRAANPDIVAAVDFNSNPIDPFVHYLQFGEREILAGNRTLDGLIGFDPIFYRDNNPDVAEFINAGVEGNLGLITYFQHFVDFGFDEGRDGVPDDGLRLIADPVGLI